MLRYKNEWDKNNLKIHK